MISTQRSAGTAGLTVMKMVLPLRLIILRPDTITVVLGPPTPLGIIFNDMPCYPRIVLGR